MQSAPRPTSQSTGSSVTLSMPPWAGRGTHCPPPAPILSTTRCQVETRKTWTRAPLPARKAEADARWLWPWWQTRLRGREGREAALGSVSAAFPRSKTVVSSPGSAPSEAGADHRADGHPTQTGLLFPGVARLTSHLLPAPSLHLP